MSPRRPRILKLIRDLQRRTNTAVLFITHDFGVVAEIADRVVVMQHGRIVEQGPTDQVLNHPTHRLHEAAHRRRAAAEGPRRRESCRQTTSSPSPMSPRLIAPAASSAAVRASPPR